MEHASDGNKTLWTPNKLLEDQGQCICVVTWMLVLDSVLPIWSISIFLSLDYCSIISSYICLFCVVKSKVMAMFYEKAATTYFMNRQQTVRMADKTLVPPYPSPPNAKPPGVVHIKCQETGKENNHWPFIPLPIPPLFTRIKGVPMLFALPDFNCGEHFLHSCHL